MRSVELAEATESLSQYIQALGKEPLLVTIKVTPVAVLTPIADLESLPLETNPESITLIQKSLQRQSSDCSTSLADYVRSLGREPAILLRRRYAIAAFNGKPVAVLVAIADIESVSLSYNPQFLEIIDRAREQKKAGKVMRSEDVRKKLGL
jgi:antitoxin (DNA-binding transcriptional repressor) of toxin-antitoxin stability system